MTNSYWKPRKIVGGLLGPVVLLAVLPAQATAYQRPGRTERVSVASDGTEATGGVSRNDGPAISPDGRHVVFTSEASNLVPGITNGLSDVFIRDLGTEVTERISVSTDSAEGNGPSFAPGIATNGRFVAFTSAASNLVPGDTNAHVDIFVRDRQAGTTERVTVATDGTQADASSFSPAISADGRFVAFESLATNLVPGDSNEVWDIFVRDRQTGTTERVSVAGVQADASSLSPAIRGDGRYVAFTSEASNLVSGGSVIGIFVRDRQAQTTQRVSVAGDGSLANSVSYSAAISADGGSVAFVSFATNLVPGDTNEAWDVFVRDRQAGTTERVSVAGDGGQAGSDSYGSPGISAHGRYVSFASYASDLVPGDTNEAWDVFLRDREAGVTERVSVTGEGAQVASASDAPGISSDGRYVAFRSYASNLVPGDGNGAADVFLRDRGPRSGVGGISAVSEEGSVSVSGWATLSGAIVTSVADAEDDGGPGAREAGGELTAAVLTYRPEQEDILVRLRLASMPPSFQDCIHVDLSIRRTVCASTGAGAPTIVYGLGFAVGDDRYEIRAVPRGPVAARLDSMRHSVDASHFGLYRCEDACLETASLSGGIGTMGTEVLVSVPLSVLGAEEGAALTGARAFTAEGEAAPGAVTLFDHADLPDALIPQSKVSLGIAPAGTSREDVAFSAAATLAQGRFAGSLDASGLSGPVDVWARACLGTGCGADAVRVQI